MVKIVLIVVFSAFASAVLFAASPMFRVLQGGGMAALSSISVDTNWGTTTCNSVGTCTATSPTRTLTVPAGNPGQVRFDSDTSAQYSKNGGTFTSFTTGQLLSVANGDTLAFKKTGLAPGFSVDIGVYDTSDSTNTGDCHLENINGGS